MKPEFGVWGIDMGTTAIKAIKYNAHNYLTKPFDDPDSVLAAVENGLAERKEKLGK